MAAIMERIPASVCEKPVGLARVAPGTRSPIKKETSASSKVRTAMYPTAARAHQEAAPLTPRVFANFCKLNFPVSYRGTKSPRVLIFYIPIQCTTRAGDIQASRQA